MLTTPSPEREIRRVCVYLASSSKAPQAYFDAAAWLGRELAQHDITIVYGGSSVGPMGALADAALAAGGRVVGVMPRFMYDVEWGHRGLSELALVENMHERKRMMIDEVDGIVALPGGSGTFEELLEAFTFKRLGLYLNPIILVNQAGYYDPLVLQFQRAVDQDLMAPRHLDIWSVVSNVSAVLPALHAAPGWGEDALGFAAV